MEATPPTPAPLSERLPRYLTAFALGLAGGGLAGVIVWLATALRLIDAIAYVYSGLGALLLLVGGIRGSGYGRPGGALDEAVAGRRSSREGSAGAAAPRRTGWPSGHDPLERRRRRMSFAPDPGSFWQVMAGFAYLGLGVALNLLFAPPPG